MRWFALIALGAVALPAPVPPSPPNQACAVTPGEQLFDAVGAHGEILQIVSMATWATSTDGGEHWHTDNDRCLSDGALFFWRLPANAGRQCMAVPVEKDNRSAVDHRCTADAGRTWFSWVVTDASRSDLLDVTANPRAPDDMIAVQTYRGGIPTFEGLTRSHNAGRAWQPQWLAGSLQIVGVVDDKLALALKGPTFEAYKELWYLPFTNGRERQIDGPWTQHLSAQLTQAVVNPANANQILVSAWLPKERREITYVSHNRGRDFDTLEVPANAFWPLEFVDAEGSLVVNLRDTGHEGSAPHASLYSPASQSWKTFALPEYTRRAEARGGALFATGGSVYRMQAMTDDGPSWRNISPP